MKCPGCGGPLGHTERLGIAFAVCGDCRGVFIGREALAAMVARAGGEGRETDFIGQHREGGPDQSGRTDERRIDFAAEARLHDPLRDKRPAGPAPSFLRQLFDI